MRSLRTHVIVASALSTSSPILSAATPTQRHVVGVFSLTTGPPVLSTVLATQRHVAGVQALVSASPVLAAGAVSQKHVVTLFGKTVGGGGDPLAGVLLNYDASNAASITGTNPITAVDDLSSYGNDGTTQAPLPTYSAATKAFRNGIVNINHSAIGPEWNAFFVATRLGATDDFRSILYNGAGQVFILTPGGSNALGTYSAGFAAAGSLTWAQNELHLVRCQNLSTGTSLSLDGGSLNASGQIVGADPNFFGAWLAGSQQWGDIHQVVFLPGNASAAEIAIVEGALAHKWDAELGVSTLVSALPAGHPYKSAPPSAGGLSLPTLVISTAAGGVAVALTALTVSARPSRRSSSRSCISSRRA